MQVSIPVRLFALPAYRTFKNEDGSERSAFITQAIVGTDAVKFYTDDDPTEALNGTRKRLEDGSMVDVTAQLRLYPRRSGMGVALEGFAEQAK